MDAAEILFADGGSAFYGRVGQTNTYIAEPGDGSMLSKNANGTWVLVDVDGSICTFDQANAVTAIAKLTAVEVVDAAPGKGMLSYGFSSDGSKLTSVTDGAGRQLAFNWHSLNPTGCANAILCITGPDSVTWRYIGDAGGGTSGRLIRVNNGTRDVAAAEYDVVGLVYKVRNANDLDPSAASPGYNPDHVVTIAYCCGTGDRRVMWINDGYITLADGGSQSATTWFEYHPGNVATTATRAAHGALPAGTVRTAAGYATVQPPRQDGAQNPKLIKSYYDTAGREIETVDILGNVTMAGYDAKDRLLWTEDEEGNPTDYNWDTVNDVLLSTTGPDPDGAGPLSRPITTNRYDEQQIGTASSPGAALTGLQASYYGNGNLAGRPTVRRTDSAVDFDWGTGGPSGITATDNFSVRWTGNLIVPTTASYVFSTHADDGTRLTIDGIQLIDNWIEQPAASVNSRSITLSAGTHKLLLEYYDSTGPASVQLRWDGPSIPMQTIPTSALRPGWFNQTSTVSPLGKVAFSHFADPASMRSDYNLARLADGTNVITSFSHDAYGRVTQKVMPKGNAGRTMDGNGNLQGSPDSTYATNWSYYGSTDAAARPAACGGGSAVNQGELLKDVTPRGIATTTHVYDRAGRPIATTKGVGTICRAYDNEGRTTSEIAPGDAQATTYSYDPGGALRTATNETGTVTSDYDEVGRVKRSIDSFGAEATFLYDQHGNITRRRAATGPLASSTNFITDYVYDDADRMTSLTDPAGRAYSFSYDARDSLRTIQYPNGTFAWHDYNAAGWLTGLYNRHGTLPTPLPAAVPADSQASPIIDFAYSHELEGRKTEEVRSGGGLGTQSTAYSYDELGRLSQVVLPSGIVRRYLFDLDSNRAEIKENGQTTATYSYDPNDADSPGVDQLSSQTEPSRTFSHRPDGEMTQRGSDTITWDGWGRHTGGTFGGATVSYQIDALGFRRQRAAGGVTTRHPLSGLFETDGAGAVQLTEVDGPAGDLAHYAGPPVSSTTVAFLHYNGHGDLAASSDQTGMRGHEYTYDPFGAANQALPTNLSVEAFASRWDKKLDTNAALIEMGIRPYDPALGRFLALDPVDGASFNHYDYALQDPINLYDLDGRRPDRGGVGRFEGNGGQGPCCATRYSSPPYAEPPIPTRRLSRPRSREGKRMRALNQARRRGTLDTPRGHWETAGGPRHTGRGPRRLKGSQSWEQDFRNRRTGECWTEHWFVTPDGRTHDPHYRPC
ncbi:MAG TPA: PA14 domain-containing protein [Gaiellaceae bacterium]|nr:PA14 domain-containing protein [Gaiellaceae bacterium]